MSRLPLMAAGLALAASAAIGQTPSPGFFPPTPDGDVALTKIVPPKEPTPEIVAAQVDRVEAERVAAVRAAREAEVRQAEDETARAEREAAREQARAQAAPAPVQGAFTGLTSERDR